jgi:hypothetical protein
VKILSRPLARRPISPGLHSQIPRSPRRTTSRRRSARAKARAELRDGLTVAEEPDAPIKRSPDEEKLHQEYLAEGKRLNAAEDAAREAGEDARVELAFRDYELELAGAASDSEIFKALSDLKVRVHPDDYEEALWELVENYEGMSIEEALEDPENQDALAQTFQRFDKQADLVTNLEAAVKAQHVAEQLAPMAAEARAEEVHGLVKSWAHDIGAMSDAEAQQRLAAAVAFARDHLNVDLEQMSQSMQGWDANAFDGILRSADAALHEQGRADANRAFQEAVANVEDTSVAGGLERFTAFGWQRLSELDLGPAELDPDAVVARATRRRATSEQIKAGVAETDSRSVADGVTVNGKPTSLPEASGAAERYRQEREAERRRMRQFLPG